MAYQQGNFRKDYEVVQNTMNRIHNLKELAPGVRVVFEKKVPWNVAWNLYQNTLTAPLKCQIFGRWKQAPTGFIEQLPPDKIGITDLERQNFGVTSNQQAGSALQMGAQNWNFTINDTWLLAGVHSHQDFYPASPVNEENIFSPKYGLTITGRELYGLARFGYKQLQRQFQPGGVTHQGYYCANTNAADEANLVDYQADIGYLVQGKTGAAAVAAAKEFFQSKGFTIAA